MIKALIVVGGVAGPVAAMALRRAGFDAIVYEAHAQTSKDVGSYLAVATNGLDALRALNAHQPVMSAGFPTRYIVLLSGTGKRLGKVPIRGTLPDGSVSVTIKRARLHRALHQQATSHGIPIKFGKRLLDAETAPHVGIVARFEDGSQATGDLLIGRDGVHSITRRIIDPTAPTGRYVGLVNFGGYTRNLAVPVEQGVWHMVFGKRAFFGYVVDNTGGIVWFANVPRGEANRSESETTTTDQWKRHLFEMFTGDRSPAAKIIAAGELELAADNTYDLPSVPTWYRGPMIIIGDAAHAPRPHRDRVPPWLSRTPSSLRSACAICPGWRRRSQFTNDFVANESNESSLREHARAATRPPDQLAGIVRDFMLPFVQRSLLTGSTITTSSGTSPWFSTLTIRPSAVLQKLSDRA